MRQLSTIPRAVACHRTLLMGTVMAALAVRLAWVAFVDDGLNNLTLPPLDDRGPAYTELLTRRLTDDQAFYVRSAQYLAEGHGYREPFSESVTARWPPGYPLVLSAIFAAVGPSLLAAQVLNVVLGAASVGLLYFLGARLFDRRVALIAAALLAFFPAQVYFSSLLMTEVLVTAGLLALVWFLVVHLGRGHALTWRRLLIAGLAIGALALVRGEVLLLAPMLGLYWLVGHASWREAAARTGLLLCGAALLFIPWTVRNAVQLEAVVVATTGTGGALIQGHAEDAGGELNQKIYNELSVRYVDRPEPERQVAENATGIREALQFIITHPLDELRLIPAKVYFLFRDDPGGRTWAQLRRLGVDHEDVFRKLGDSYYFVVLLLAVVGVAVSARELQRGERPLLLLVVGLWLFVYGFVYVGDGRYHFPLVPILCLFAGLFLRRALKDASEQA